MRFLAAILIFSLVSVPVYADKVILEHNGETGIWFDEDSATLLLKDVTGLNILRNKTIPSLEVKIELLELNIENYKLKVDTFKSISENWENQFIKCEKTREADFKKYEKSLEKKDKWYKSPAFLMLSGFILGGVLTVGIAIGVNR